MTGYYISYNSMYYMGLRILYEVISKCSSSKSNPCRKVISVLADPLIERCLVERKRELTDGRRRLE